MISMPLPSDRFSVRDAIADIFRWYGGYVAPSVTDPPYLRVITDDLKVAVGYHVATAPPIPRTLDRFIESTDDSFFHHLVFLTNHDLHPGLVDRAREWKVILLGREDLEIELGKAHLGILERMYDIRFVSVDDLVHGHPLVQRLLAGSRGGAAGVAPWQTRDAAGYPGYPDGETRAGTEEGRDVDGSDSLSAGVFEGNPGTGAGTGSGGWPCDGSGHLVQPPVNAGSGLSRMLAFYREKNTPPPEEGGHAPHRGNHGDDDVSERSPSGSSPLNTTPPFTSSLSGSPSSIPSHDSLPSYCPSPIPSPTSPPSPYLDGNWTSAQGQPRPMREPLNTPHPYPLTEPGWIIPPEVSTRRIADLAECIAPVTHLQLELVPYLVFDYTCTVMVRGEDGTHRRQGIVAVNGVTREAEEWEPGFATVEELAMNYIRLTPLVEPGEARDLALDGVTRIETRVIRTTVEEDGIPRGTSRRVVPDPSGICLIWRGHHYLPCWHVRGDGGSLLMDAVNGEILSGPDGPPGHGDGETEHDPSMDRGPDGVYRQPKS